MTLHRVLNRGARNRHFTVTDITDKILDKLNISASVRIVGYIDINNTVKMLATGSRVNERNGEFSALECSEDLALCTDYMDFSLRNRRSAYHIVCAGCTALKADGKTLMVNDIVVALVGTNAVWTCFEKLDFVLERCVFPVLKLVPNVE